MPHLLAVVVGATLALAAASVSAAPNAHLGRARRELDALKFEEARASLKAALRAGGSTPTETAEIYLLTGQVSAALGDVAAAEDAFRRLLSLKPAARLPDGTSPKISAPFNAAQARSRGASPLAFTPEPETGWPLVVNVTVDADPLQLVAGAEVRYWVSGGGAPEKASARGSGRIVVKLPAGATPEGTLVGTVAVIDQHGNALREAGTAAAPLELWRPEVAAARPPTSPDVDEISRPFYARPYTWAAIAVGFAAVGGYYAFKAASTQDELDDLNATSSTHEFSEALAVEERGEREALIANVSFAAAGVFAIVTTVLIIRDLRRKEEVTSTETTISPTATSGGAGLVVTGRF